MRFDVVDAEHHVIRGRDLARNEEFSKIAVINFFLQFSKKMQLSVGGGLCGGNFEISHANQLFNVHCLLTNEKDIIYTSILI